MRRYTRCFFSLALLFTLGSLLPSHVSAGDRLPPDCCQFFCEADFNPLSDDYQSRHSMLSARSNSSAISNSTPIRGLSISRSALKWNFNYGPAKPEVPRTVSVIALRKRGHICFRLSSVKSTPAIKKQSAPALYWSTGSLANLSILMRLVANEANSAISAWIVPPRQLPIRILRLISDLISIR